MGHSRRSIWANSEYQRHLYLIGGVGPITFAWLLLVCAAFNLSIAATCHLALRRLPPPQDGA